MKTVKFFNETPPYSEQAIIMIYDLDGFSAFVNQPDAHNYVSTFLNVVYEAMNIIIDGGFAYWDKINKEPDGTAVKYHPLPKPIHSKFLGDGALYIWKHQDFKHYNIIPLVNRLFNLRDYFPQIITKAADSIPIVALPVNIRFGITAGSVYKLTYNDNSGEEYVGHCINLASRLQNYCREIGFIISGRLNIKKTDIEKYEYTKQVATNLKGFQPETVLIDKKGFNKLNPMVRSSLFRSPTWAENFSITGL